MDFVTWPIKYILNQIFSQFLFCLEIILIFYMKILKLEKHREVANNFKMFGHAPIH